MRTPRSGLIVLNDPEVPPCCPLAAPQHTASCRPVILARTWGAGARAAEIEEGRGVQEAGARKLPRARSGPGRRGDVEARKGGVSREQSPGRKEGRCGGLHGLGGPLMPCTPRHSEPDCFMVWCGCDAAWDPGTVIERRLSPRRRYGDAEVPRFWRGKWRLCRPPAGRRQARPGTDLRGFARGVRGEAAAVGRGAVRRWGGPTRWTSRSRSWRAAGRAAATATPSRTPGRSA